MESMNLMKQQRHQSKKLRDSARGQNCLIRIPDYCNHDSSTVVLCHLNGGGTGTKKSDLFGAFGCSGCHDVIDGRVKARQYTMDEIELMHREGVERTQQFWLDIGLVTLK